jgi:hypothetical protein
LSFGIAALWRKPLLERRIKVWQLRLNLESPQEVARPETLDHIERRFLPDLLRDLGDIVSGQRRDWSLPPDEVFLLCRVRSYVEFDRLSL